MKKALLALATAFTFISNAQTDISCTLLSPADGHQYATTDTNRLFFSITNEGTTALTNEDTLYFSLSIGGFAIPLINGITATAALPLIRQTNPADTNSQLDLMPDSTVYGAWQLNYFLNQAAIDSFDVYNHQTCINVQIWNNTTNTWNTDANPADNLGCNASNPVGIDEIENKFSTYPNPVVNTLFVETESEKAEFRIYNMKGSLVSTTNISNGTNQVDVSELNKGFFFYIIRENNTNIGSGKFSK